MLRRSSNFRLPSLETDNDHDIEKVVAALAIPGQARLTRCVFVQQTLKSVISKVQSDQADAKICPVGYLRRETDPGSGADI